jgi:putative peptidoglycan lipid II flippase
VAGWVELLLLRRTLNERIGHTGLPVSIGIKLWIAALLAAGVAWGVKRVLPPLHPIATAVLIFGPYACVYIGMTIAMGVDDARRLISRVARRRGWT